MSDSTIYVICVNMPGYLPEMEPYAVKGAEAAYACALIELEDGDSLGYSFPEFLSALEAGGADSPVMESGYVVSVSPLDSLGLPAEDHADYVEQASV